MSASHPRCGRHRLFRRIWLHGLLLLAAAGAAFTAIAVWPGPGSPEHLREEGPARFLAATLGPRLGDPPALAAELARLNRAFRADLAVYGPGGENLASAGRRPPPPLGPRRARTLGAWRLVRSGRISALAVGLPGGAYVIVARSPSWHTRFLLLLAAVLLAAAHFSFPLARAIARPLERLTETSRRLAAGDFAARSGIARDDEVGALASAMDEMAAGLEARIRRERELLANVSHELRTPLARLRVALELAEEAGDAAAVRAQLAGIAQDVGELERLVADVLAASRLDAAAEGQRLARGPLPPASLVNEAAERFRRGHPQRELRLRLPEGLPEIRADRVLLGRVLDNLLENALRYTDPGTPIELGARTEAKNLVVEVADRGFGVPVEDLPRLFEPFFRTERSRSREAGGTGLGLTLCKRIVETHGGSIVAATNPGGGLVVTFRVPE